MQDMIHLVRCDQGQFLWRAIDAGEIKSCILIWDRALIFQHSSHRRKGRRAEISVTQELEEKILTYSTPWTKKE